MRPDLATFLALEDRLLAGEFGTLLHPDFLEFGASGRRWTRAEVLAELAPAGHVTQRNNLELHPVSDDVVLLTWNSQHPAGTRVWRSSLWQRSASLNWQLRFHQATPVP